MESPHPQPPQPESSRLVTAALALVSLTTLLTRLTGLSLGHQVCWDETHFGRMAGWYHNRTYYFDVHPPLGKLLIAGVGKLVGYDGSFKFREPGDDFSEHSEVLMMRYCMAILGSAIVPIGFLTVWSMTGSVRASTTAALLLIFDTGMTTISRFILLDQPLLLAIALAFLAMRRFLQVPQERTFSAQWTLRLFLVGLSLGAAISVKFVGVFIVSYVGLLTIHQLWAITGDMKTTLGTFLKHFSYRAVFLILLPLSMYVGFFLLHFLLLSKSGPGDFQHSPLFQSSLEGNHLAGRAVVREVRDGALITLRGCISMPCGYLHSHWDLYPHGAGETQQMVGTYLFRDDNNQWQIRKMMESNLSSEVVRHGDVVRLEHRVTGRNLHSHDVPALRDKRMYQVTGYGEQGRGDDNDLWRIETVGGREGDIVTAFTSKLRFRHVHLGCLLTCVGTPLPKEWGYMMMEVTCSPWLRVRHNIAIRGIQEPTWLIEENIPPGNEEPTNVTAGFWFKFLELQEVMFFMMKRIGIQQDPLESQPSHEAWKWPFNLNTQKFCPREPRVTLVGNPLVYWVNLGFLLLYLLVSAVRIFQTSREPERLESESPADELLAGAGHLLLAYLLHYLPFFKISRQLYIHHYLPAFYFSCLLSAVLMEYLFRKIQEKNSVFKESRESVAVRSEFITVNFRAFYYGLATVVSWLLSSTPSTTFLPPCTEWREMRTILQNCQTLPIITCIGSIPGICK